MSRKTLQFEADELDLTIRALQEMRERGEVSLRENDTLVNLIDYLKMELSLITIEDYTYYHDQHCPVLAEHGACSCWRPTKEEKPTDVGPDP